MKGGLKRAFGLVCSFSFSERAPAPLPPPPFPCMVVSVPLESESLVFEKTSIMTTPSTLFQKKKRKEKKEKKRKEKKERKKEKKGGVNVFQNRSIPRS